ncbi:hypothetical protein EMIHUDRAFT_239955 [Emiliania huxleyi CCMP1516]|uniref:Uncharacterized protein n=2 Tax=Emiliania huxleyi TaxID=2903 RepID=A0A0D3JIB0_EMIH1|nr:hypothetical protein EMIHUDRAFT_239955 [Emiliania huxleyi CCMP1516]EOD23245.1 hypothetical protein EMIHUDRAFT_239955 [Emiliania huxleyi CCMP1516]|eukprot:XP_005775674.1 hypothetical protein EMIHUDRAFT_239955 [Emiliania huxleyi CCMP1516]
MLPRRVTTVTMGVSVGKNFRKYCLARHWAQLERAVRHERQAQATEPPASASPAAPPAPAAEPPAAEPATNMTKRGQQQRGKGRSASGRASAGPRLVDKNALSARGGGPSRQSRSPSPDSPPAKRASSADSSGYDTDLPDEEKLAKTEGGNGESDTNNEGNGHSGCRMLLG